MHKKGGNMIISNLKDLDLTDSELGKLMRLSELLCNDGIIRKGRFLRKTKIISKASVQKHLNMSSPTTFRSFFQSLEKLNIVRRVMEKGKFLVIYMNPKYIQTDNYIENEKLIKIFPKSITTKKKQNKYYVYRFLDINDNVIYIGRTKNISNRINGHISSGHLPNECYTSIEKIEYIELETFADMCIYEIYYINEYFPLYNTSEKDLEGIKSTINISEIEWQIYNIKE